MLSSVEGAECLIDTIPVSDSDSLVLGCHLKRQQPFIDCSLPHSSQPQCAHSQRRILSYMLQQT